MSKPMGVVVPLPEAFFLKTSTPVGENIFGGWKRVVWDPKPRGVAVPLPPAVLFFANKHPPWEKRCVLGWGGWFWTPFSEKMFQIPDVLHGLGAGEGAGPDEPDGPDDPEMVHSQQFRP